MTDVLVENGSADPAYPPVLLSEASATPSCEWYKERFTDPKLNQILTLQNGKKVSVAEVGDASASPVFIFPGLGGARQFLVLYEKQAKDNNLRLISPDRPGVGLSDDADSNEGKQPLAWPDIVAQVADQLHVDRFGLMGHSCGAVFALACAVKIPQRIIGEIHLISPWIPLSAPGTKSSLKMAQYAPSFMVGASSSVMSSFPNIMSSMGSINLMTKGWSKNEAKQFDKNFFQEFFSITANENRSGGFKNGMMVCLEKYGPWDFKYEDITIPCQMFHGDQDNMVPLAAAKWASTAMVNCQLTVFEDSTHNCLMDFEKTDMVFKNLGASMNASKE